MFEKDLNTDLTRMFNGKGWAYKIPDPPATVALMASQRPFDGVAAFSGFDFFYESKLIKNKIEAFSISRIEPHQFENLLKLRELGKETAVVLGVWIARKAYQVLLFDVFFLYTLGSKSVLKKELEWLISEGYAIDMRHPENFEPSQLIERRVASLPGRGNGKVHR
jgi:penicillin-binding protein-related factor A (putative recombinase)